MTHPIGSFKVTDLVSAFEKVDSSHNDAAYDYVANNCGDLHLSLAKELGIVVDTDTKSFVIRRLVEDAGTAMIEGIQNSPYFSKVFGPRNLRADSLSDKDLIRILVEEKTSV